MTGAASPQSAWNLQEQGVTCAVTTLRFDPAPLSSNHVVPLVLLLPLVSASSTISLVCVCELADFQPSVFNNRSISQLLEFQSVAGKQHFPLYCTAASSPTLQKPVNIFSSLVSSIIDTRKSIVCTGAQKNDCNVVQASLQQPHYSPFAACTLPIALRPGSQRLRATCDTWLTFNVVSRAKLSRMNEV